jgi:O-antigen/teichoic acid export membrane protein
LTATERAKRPPSDRQTLDAIARSKLFLQTTLFAAFSAVASLVSAVAIAILARNLSVSAFGSFSFALSFLTFSAMFFEFGIFAAVSRMAAQSQGRDRREVLGSALLLFVPIAFAFVLTTFVASFWVDEVFNVDAGFALRVTAPLAFVYVFASIAVQIAQGADRLHVYSVTSALAQVTFLLLIAIAVASTNSIGVSIPLAARGAAALAAMTVVTLWLRPVFASTRKHVREIISQARAYGVQVYVGRLLGIGTYNMDVLMVGAWTSADQVGLYTLAAAMAAVVGLPVTGFSAALFPRLVRHHTVDRRWLLVSTASGVAGIIFLWLFQGPLVKLFFSSRYGDVGEYVVPLAAAQAVRGVTGIYNSFLAAHGYGRDLRNAALVLTASNVALNFALIPPYGALGAAWASFFALVANLGAHMIFYRRQTGSADVVRGEAEA